MSPLPRILIVEDHPLVRDGLRLLLGQSGMDVCGEAESRGEALAALGATKPDLLMVDLTLWGESGLDLIRALPEGKDAPPVLVYSMHESGLHVRLALQAGAEGYVTKRELSEVLLEAVHRLLAGETYLSPRARRAIAEECGELRLEGLEECSPQEMEILRMMGHGLGVGDIAEAMALSRKTVESYCGRIQVKMNVKGMKELRLIALGGLGVATTEA